MMIESNSDERDTQAIYTLKRLTEIVVVLDRLSCGSILYTSLDQLIFISLDWFAFFLCVYCNSLGFVFSESISYVFREVRLLKWPVTINNFALGL